MRVLTGDECGILKETLPNLKKEKIVCLPSTASRRKGVVSLAWTNKDQDVSTDQQFASLHLDATVTLWERSNESTRSFSKYHSLREICNVFKDCTVSETNRPLGLAAIGDDRLLACNTFGQATIVKPLAPEPIVQRFETVSIPQIGTVESKHELLSCMAVHTESNKLALGGKDRETIIIDTASTKQIFKCKNLPSDPQTLLAPLVWPTCIEFMGENGGNTFAVGTAHHEVRIYDARVARRPVQYTPDHLLEYRVTALCHNTKHHEHEIFVGDAAGTILKLDLRALGRGTCKVNPLRYVGPGGSVRGLKVRENKLVAVGLDRMLRVYDVKTTREIESIYMKQRMNCILLGREPWETDEEVADDGDIDQEDIVRDYVDSDQEEEEEEDDDDDDEGDGGADDDGEDSASSGDELDDDDTKHNFDADKVLYRKEGEGSSDDDASSPDEVASPENNDQDVEPLAKKTQSPLARKRQKR
ncbi:hypothetical protein MPSEU_000484100 [Mayamaea pseudoterrestris]|nr:hypothetical protein MPSEU_000484100 [Mayamaea pseudoterrestris]